MEPWKDRRIVTVVGVCVALLLGLLIVLHLSHTKKSDQPPPADQAGMVIRQGRPDDAKLDPKRQLGCFVAGQYIGQATWADCAKKNGVATGDLDVGIDAQGGLAGAAPNTGTALTPLPPADAPAAPVPAAQIPAPQPSATQPLQSTPVASAGSACWRFSDRTWYRMADMSRAACVQTLFAGRCEKPGSATYGRWGDQTLRLVPGKVEASDDNHNFHTVAEQQPNCSFSTS
jgi:hypothetical protein